MPIECGYYPVWVHPDCLAPCLSGSKKVLGATCFFHRECISYYSVFFLCLPSLGVPHQASPVYLLFGTLGLVSLLFILHCLIVLSDQYAVLTYEYEAGFSFYAETYKVHFPSVDLNGLVTIEALSSSKGNSR